MMRVLAVRLGRLEATASHELPPELRQWLGEPITEAERASIKPVRVLTEAEEAAEIAALPADLREWFGGRLHPTLQEEGR